MPDPNWEPSFLPERGDITKPHENLNTIHRQYLYHYMRGLSFEQIADLYGKESSDSVHRMFKRIRANLGANSNAHAVAKMIWWEASR